jgi:phage terminase large subunit-like protein
VSELTYLERARAYAERVVRGEEVAGKYERLFCARFLRDLQRQADPSFPFEFDESAGARACQFLELLPHIKGDWAKKLPGEDVGQKLKLEDWQLAFVLQLFGWKCRYGKRAGRRRFLRAYMEVARKNAKSTLAAGILLYMLVADNEPGAQVYSAATTGEQAREVFDVAREMAKRAPEFRERFGVDVQKHALVVGDSASSAKPLNAESSTQDGLNIHCAVVDELHAHKTRGLYDVLDTATGARSQPLILMITTAGTDTAGICYEQRGYTIQVLEGTVPVDGGTDEDWLGVIFTLDEGDDWKDPKNWRKANPNLNVSVFLHDMEAACRKVIGKPAALTNFKTKRLNIWCSADSAAFDIEAWKKCADPELTRETVAHLPCWIPLDLASKIDVAALPLVFFDEDEEIYYIVTKGRLFLPEHAVRTGTNSQYEGWAEEGWIAVTEGEVTDFDEIEEVLRTDCAELNVQELPYDPWQATQLAGHMLDDGAPMVEYRQTVQNMSEPMKTLQAAIIARKVRHDDNPVMTWMMGNVVGHLDAKENIYPRKARVENKIDGPVAVIMGIGRIIGQHDDEEEMPSGYSFATV